MTGHVSVDEFYAFLDKDGDGEVTVLEFMTGLQGLKKKRERRRVSLDMEVKEQAERKALSALRAEQVRKKIDAAKILEKPDDEDFYREKTLRMRERREQEKLASIKANEEAHQAKLRAESEARAARLSVKLGKESLRQEVKSKRAQLIYEQVQAELDKAKSRRARAAARLEAAKPRPGTPGAADQGVAGYHEVEYDAGDRYAGDWNIEGKREGFGVLTFADGSKYSGQFEAGVASGIGMVVFADYSTYEGEWEHDRFNGFGIWVSAAGFKFEGQFATSEPKGFGKFTFPGGESGRPRLEGEWHGMECSRRCAVPRIVQEAQAMAEAAREAEC